MGLYTAPDPTASFAWTGYRAPAPQPSAPSAPPVSKTPQGGSQVPWTGYHASEPDDRLAVALPPPRPEGGPGGWLVRMTRRLRETQELERAQQAARAQQLSAPPPPSFGGRAATELEERKDVIAPKDPVVATIAREPQGEAREELGRLGELLYQGSIGQGPSAAQDLLRQGLEQEQAAAASAAAGARGLSPAQALYMQQQQMAESGQRIRGEMAAMAADQQAQAQQLLGEMWTIVRGQDIKLATSQAGFEHEVNLATPELQIRYRAATDDAISSLLALGLSDEDSKRQAETAMSLILVRERMHTRQLQLERDLAEGNITQQMFDTGMQVLGFVIAGVATVLAGPIAGVATLAITSSIGGAASAVSPSRAGSLVTAPIS